MALNIVDKETIKNGESFIIKWSKSPRDDGGAINPGWKQQTEIDRFLELVEKVPSILNDVRFIQMDSIEHDISYMRVNGRLKSMKKLSGDNKGAQKTDDYNKMKKVVPEFSRNSLNAEPFSMLSYTAKTFLLENIEKASYLPHLEARLAEEAGVSAENIGMYGIKDANTTDDDGIHQIDGVFKQLQDIAAKYPTWKQIDRKAPMGYCLK